jgi:hypothetical protein
VDIVFFNTVLAPKQHWRCCEAKNKQTEATLHKNTLLAVFKEGPRLPACEMSLCKILKGGCG